MRRKPLLAIILVAVIALAWLLNSVIVPQAVLAIRTRHLRQVFSAQTAILTAPINSLGIQGTPAIASLCSLTNSNHIASKANCQVYTIYPTSVESGLENGYARQATKLDAILSTHGWTNDSPRRAHVTLASLATLNTTNETAVDIPFHKNMGSVSCTLDINFYTSDSYLTPETGTLIVNQFACSTNTTYPELRISIPQVTSN